MDADKRRKQIACLTVALIYLTAWEEKAITGETIRRAWKGYEFNILDELQQAGLINTSRNAKSLYLTEHGEKEAEAVLNEITF
jgi:DNA-binding PadR family transcriptional regulator